jgi:hypothetical protein
MKFSNFFYGIQQGKIMGLEGVFMVSDYGKKFSEHFITFRWVLFAGKMPASNILYRILWVQEDERRARIVNPPERTLWMQQGLSP